MRTIILIFFAFTLSLTSLSYAQQSKISNLENLTTFTPTNISQDGDTLYEIKYRFTLIDSLNVDKVTIEIGSTFNGNDIYQGEYYYYSSEENDTVFSASGLKITGSAGNHPGGFYFYKITAEDFQGNKYKAYIRQQ